MFNCSISYLSLNWILFLINQIKLIHLINVIPHNKEYMLIVQSYLDKDCLQGKLDRYIMKAPSSNYIVGTFTLDIHIAPIPRNSFHANISQREIFKCFKEFIKG